MADVDAARDHDQAPAGARQIPQRHGPRLGARALYLFTRAGDTGYRLHGTPEWNSIGHAMSSGCIRLINQDIIDLYDRAEVGAKVVVM
jgi:lipoprotein-anchoring transpeptidase ErfK/SrfK